ncbi:hypothetical protein I2494_00440 [Budviciaceae bacterium BWR-B9]|uniref:Toxin VasX N-terminal region domain-containing protein n=1 Tax=Limnobaculum allomyrinae TaxID=2791986 RepID=A0ABS1IKB7_9GAMM|nr:MULTISPECIES: toxin VasX [Limnobaculum]MBK5142199.1 hypothetical protein [Limnobaculum allomyrinae]MBV7690917.1 hypothetical protein [Limnobaculum sp. M2-1]
MSENTNNKQQDNFLYETAEKKSALSGNECGVCKRKGFPLFLVRKAIIRKDYKVSGWSENIASLGSREPKNKLSNYSYAYRTLRTGYVYILLTRTKAGTEKGQEVGSKEFLGYEITPSGVFRHKSIDEMQEKFVKELPVSCTSQNHNIPGLFVHIDTEVYGGEAYVAYSRRAWSKDVRKQYETEPAGSKKLKRFSKINLDQKNSPADLSSEGRSFAFSDLSGGSKKLMELLLSQEQVTYHFYQDEEKSTQEKNKSTNNFATIHQFNSLKADSGLVDLEVTRLQSTGDAYQVSSVAALVVEDTFGVAEELSYQRQLMIKPIAMAIVEAESIFTTSMQSIYDKALEGNTQIDNVLKEDIDDYRKQHPEESQIMYDEDYKEGDINERKYGMSPSGTYVTMTNVKIGERSFLDKNYLRKSSGPYSYFNEKNLHLRKILTYIDNYKLERKTYLESTVGDYTHTQYGMIVEGSKLAMYVPPGHIEVPMTALEIAAEKAKFNPGECYDVKRYKKPDTAAANVNQQLNKEWSRLEKRLSTSRISDFRKQDKAMYDKLIKDIHDFSVDYFTYTTWLLGSSDGSSKSTFAPDPGSYNDVPFWNIECETNCSNNHIGYVMDLIQIMDFTSLGNIKLDYQFGVWDVLLRDKSTLYYHLFKGSAEAKEQKSSFWNMLLELRQKQSEEKKRVISTKEVISIIEKTHNGKLDIQFTAEKGQHLVNLYELLIAKASAGVSQKYHDDKMIGLELFRVHIMEAMMALNGTETCTVEATVNIRDAAAIARCYALNSVVFVDSSTGEQTDRNTSILPAIPTLTEADSAATVTLQLVSVGENIDELYNTFKPLILNSSGGINSASEFRTALRELNDKKGFLQLGSLTTAPDLSAMSNNTVRTIVTDNAKASFFTAASLISELASYNENKEKLAAVTGLGQTERDEISRSLEISFATIVATSVKLIDSTVKSLGMSFHMLMAGTPQLTSAMQSAAKALYFSGNISVITASGVLAIVGIIEGVTNLSKSRKMLAAGENKLGYVYCIGGGLQIFSSSILLLQSLGIIGVMGIFGGILLALGIIAGIAALLLFWVFSDDSDNWEAIELWLNRCLFGNWEHKEKGSPYPLTKIGMANALNDYFVARMGMKSVLNIEKESSLIGSSDIATDKQAEIEAMSDEEIEAAYRRIPNADDSTLGVPTSSQRAVILASERQGISGDSRALYINMSLPGYDIDLSDFKGTIRVLNIQTQQSMVLTINKDSNFPIIDSQGKLSSFSVRKNNELIESEEYSYHDQLRNMFIIYYKIGEFTGDHEICCQTQYWITKKENGKDSNPLICTYSYKAEV